jgi:hypothetical protein
MKNVQHKHTYIFCPLALKKRWGKKCQLYSFSHVLSFLLFYMVYIKNKDVAVFNEKSEEYMRSFWEVLEFLADTVVFAVSGLIVALKVWEGDIHAADWG